MDGEKLDGDAERSDESTRQVQECKKSTDDEKPIAEELSDDAVSSRVSKLFIDDRRQVS